MIAFRPLVRANPSRPSPDQAARIPSPPLPSPPATQSHPRGGATENPPIPPIPCSASITSPADRPRCCRPEADRSISLTARWLLLASLTPHQIPDGRCSPRSLAAPVTDPGASPRRSIPLRRVAIDPSIRPLPDDGRAPRIGSRRGCSGVANGRARRGDRRRGSWSSPPAAASSASSSVGADRWGRMGTCLLRTCPWESA